jgi:hypothetical protein
MLLNEYEIEFMFRKILNIRNLGNVHIRGPHIVMSRTDAQNGLNFHFNDKMPFNFKKKGLKSAFKSFHCWRLTNVGGKLKNLFWKYYNNFTLSKYIVWVGHLLWKLT